MEVEETSWFFLFRTGGKRRAMIALSISYKMELKALGSRSKDCLKFLNTCEVEIIVVV